VQVRPLLDRLGENRVVVSFLPPSPKAWALLGSNP
jgi:hypothetical protein